MENIYKISHTAFPDGSVIEYSDGMKKPEILNLNGLINKSLLNAIKQNGKKTTQVIKLKAVKQGRMHGPLYAVK